MATKLSDNPSSPTNDESDNEEPDAVDIQEEEEEEEEEEVEHKSSVQDILERLKFSGALIKKPKEEYHCYTCDEDFLDWDELENHLIQHVSLPLLVLHKLPSDDEDTVPSEDENWSDEDEPQSPPKQATNVAKKTPQKIDISQILNKTGISIKKPSEKESNNSEATLSKLSGLGFTITKNTTPIKKENPETEPPKPSQDVLQKLGQLGGIKLKLRSDGNNSNTFKVINGLQDFKASDDEDEDSSNEDAQNQVAQSSDKSEQDKKESVADNDTHIEHNKSGKNSDSDDSDHTSTNKRNLLSPPKQYPGKVIASKKEPGATSAVPQSTLKQILVTKPSGRPTVKQTPKRGANLPITSIAQKKQIASEKIAPQDQVIDKNTIENEIVNENVTVKKEIDPADESTEIPLFSGQIKTERSTPSPSENISTPVIATIKSEPDSTPNSSQRNSQNQNNLISNTDATSNMAPTSNLVASSLLPVTKTEEPVTVIEINGDSNDEDDDCCVVSATPAPDVKPIVPKNEPVLSYPPAVSFSGPQTNYSSETGMSPRIPGATSTEKQHNFNWNAPDSKPPIDILERSTDDILESFLSSTKKESFSVSDASEYISLDTLGPQHLCEVCNTRFTNTSLLEEHKRVTGHSMSLVSPSSTLLPYNQPSNLLSSLLPVKQLAEQVGKLSSMTGSGSGFTHQQNVMINIQAYPGAGGVMVPPAYPNAPYSSAQNMHSGYPHNASNNMYSSAQTMPSQYPGQNYMSQPGYGQEFQQPLSKAAYHGTMPPNSYSSAQSAAQYSSASPLQNMQQAVYGQSSSGMLTSTHVGQMGPPGSSPSHPYVPTSSPGMKPPTSTAGGIKIQNVQTFAPGQLLGAPGQPSIGQGVQMPSPGPIRMAAGANVSGPRPRMSSVRGSRPSIRPGIQVHTQLRGTGKAGPRMAIKRPGNLVGGPGQKRRSDMFLPGKHDNEDCQVMAMQKQRDGLPMIQSVQGAKDKLSSQISITKKTVNKQANAMANVLASRGISIKQKQKSRSPSPERPLPHIPNLGAGVSIKHTTKSNNFTIPEAKVGGGMMSCKICKKMFINHSLLSAHMASYHPQSKLPLFKCDECPASYPKSLQLLHHKRIFHDAAGPKNRELGLPVVDMSQEENLKRLSSLGIYSFIPLANREQADGSFGIPVISVHNMQNGMCQSLQALGADGLLSLGPLKSLPKS